MSAPRWFTDAEIQELIRSFTSRGPVVTAREVGPRPSDPVRVRRQGWGEAAFVIERRDVQSGDEVEEIRDEH